MRKRIGLIFGLLLGLFLLPQIASAEDATYLDATGTARTHNCEVITTDTRQLGAEGQEKWYVCKGNISIPNARLETSGIVHLILANDATLNLGRGLGHGWDNTLNIYCQPEAAGHAMGKFIARGGTHDGGGRDAGIGGGWGGSSGYINIHGGEIIAEGYGDAAGIGAGFLGNTRDITITGGKVTAIGHNGAAGIGCGPEGTSGPVTISGGVVSATGSSGFVKGPAIAGPFRTTDSGHAVIFAYSGGGSCIEDHSDAANWKGIIYEDNLGKVYGSPLMVSSFTNPENHHLFIGDNQSLTVNDTLTNCGVLRQRGELIGTLNNVSPGLIVTFGEVPYLDANGNEAVAADCETVNSKIYKWGEDQNSVSWFACTSSVEIPDKRVELQGTVNLILGNDATLTIPKGIYVKDDATLNIFMQQEQTGQAMGKLVIASPDGKKAGIGGNGNDEFGTINIHGGDLDVKGGGSSWNSSAAAIGGGFRGRGGAINISGGKINAQGSTFSAGIGGGRAEGSIENDTIGPITISGGEVIARSGSDGGAGIGGGNKGHVQSITISGGSVTASGTRGGCGIGAGQEGKVIEGITISGGVVKATGSMTYDSYDFKGAAIGGDVRGDGAHGSFDTTDHGTAIIYAYNGDSGVCIGDRSKESQWKGVIYEDNMGQIYGSPLTVTSFTNPAGHTLLVDEGQTLTVNDTLTNEGTIIKKGVVRKAGGDDDPIVNQHDGVVIEGSTVAVEYLDQNGAVKTADATALGQLSYVWGKYGAATWYAINDDALTIDKRVQVRGTVNLILKNDAVLTIPKGIRVPQDATLNIFMQSEQADQAMGRLLISECNDFNAGIGGERNDQAGTIHIYGGDITAKGGSGGAGIGAGKDGDVTAIGITAGRVTASGQQGGAGIGAGSNGQVSGDVVIAGGVVTATGSVSGNVRGGAISGIDTAHGGFDTTANGNTIIYAYNGGSGLCIGDRSKEDQWKGIIYEDYVGKVYGSPLRIASFTNPASHILKVNSGETLIVDDTLTNEGTIIKNGDVTVPDGTSDPIHNVGAGEVIGSSTVSVSYLDASGNTQTVDGCSVLIPQAYSIGKNNTSTWYVCNTDNLTIDKRLRLRGTVNLILGNNTTLTIPKGIHVPDGSTLNIFRQPTGEGDTIGKLVIQGVADYDAGIGGGNGERAGAINIHGGDLTVKGGGSSYIRGSAGIGGGAHGSHGPITITGGTINAEGGKSGAGIGGGVCNTACGPITISGGDIITRGGSDGGSGIGGGNNGDSYNITISGGKVDSDGKYGGAGIGAGQRGKVAGTITISGGEVIAKGGGSTHKGPAIGGENGHGTFDTTANGHAVIYAYNDSSGICIGDRSNAGHWKGVIYEDNQGMVYGSPITVSSFTNPVDHTLTINARQSLIVDQTLSNYGTIVKNGDVTSPGGEDPIRNIDGGQVITTVIQGVSYVDENGVTKTADNCEKIPDHFLGNEGISTWFVCDETTTLDQNRLEARGTVNLILCNDTTLTVVKGIHVQAPTVLNIYMQPKEDGKAAGKLIVNSPSYTEAGIGSHAAETPGTINIYGGDLDISGGMFAAGIGGGPKSSGGTVRITDGIVKANGGQPCYTGIGNGIQSQNQGTFETTENGHAIINASIGDRNHEDQWSAIIDQDDTYSIYGTQRLSDALANSTADIKIASNGKLVVDDGRTLQIAENRNLIINGILDLTDGNLTLAQGIAPDGVGSIVPQSKRIQPTVSIEAHDVEYNGSVMDLRFVLSDFKYMGDDSFIPGDVMDNIIAFINGMQPVWYDTKTDGTQGDHARKTAPENTGSYFVALKTPATGLYKEGLSSAVPFKITPQELGDEQVTIAPQQFVYDGSEKKPTVTVQFVASVLDEDGDWEDEIRSVPADQYQLTFSKDSTNVGDKTVTVTGIEGGNFSINISKPYSIVQSDSTLDDPSTDVEDGVYTYGDVITVSFTPKAATKESGRGLTATPKINEAALYLKGGDGEDDIQLSEPQSANEKKLVELTYDTTEKKIPADGARKTLVVKYMGGGNLKASTEELGVILKPKTLSVTGVTADDRPYAIGNRSVALNGGALEGVCSNNDVPDDVSLVRDPAPVGNMADANAGSMKAVSGDFTLQGAHKDFYTLKQPTLTVNITRITATTHTEAEGYVSLEGNQEQTLPLAPAIESFLIEGDTPSYGTPQVTSGSDKVEGEPVISEEGVLSYTLADGTLAGEQIDMTVDVSGLSNYQTVTIHVRVNVSGETPVRVDMSGITLEDKVYDGEPITFSGEATAEPIVPLVYKWYDSEGNELDGAPTEVGSYTLKAIANQVGTAGSASRTVKIVPAEKSYCVTVTGGSGSGTYKVGDTVTIKADERTDDHYFVCWRSDTSLNFNKNEANTTFTMPERDVNVKAIWSTHKPSTGGGSDSGGSSSGSSGGSAGSSSDNDSTEKKDSDRIIFDTGGGEALAPIAGTSGKVVDLTEYTPKRDGYTFTGWYADKKRTQKIDSVRIDDKTTVYAGWEKITESFFRDVAADDWFAGDVDFVSEHGLMVGTVEDLFSPGQTTNRAMIVAVLHRLAGNPAAEGHGGFADVAEDAWYAEPIAWAAANGVAAGYDSDHFGPTDPVTREQLAAFFYKYAQLQGWDVTAAGDLSLFTDAGHAGTWAGTPLRWAIGSGILGGKGDGILDPDGTATRAEFAAMLHRYVIHYDLPYIGV